MARDVFAKTPGEFKKTVADGILPNYKIKNIKFYEQFISSEKYSSSLKAEIHWRTIPVEKLYKDSPF